MHIVVATSSMSMSTKLTTHLASKGHRVNATGDPDDIAFFCSGTDCSVVLWDDAGSLPSAEKIVRDLRKGGISTPFIALSTDRSANAICRLLSAGADDCVSPEADIAELLARIHAVVRRSNGHAEETIRVGPAMLNLSSKTMLINGTAIPLTQKEYQIVEALCLRKNSALTKEQLMNLVYFGMDEPSTKIVDVFICKIRKKLRERGDCAELIHTVWGRGYMMSDAAQLV